jgi:hypothetical protein
MSVQGRAGSVLCEYLVRDTYCHFADICLGTAGLWAGGHILEFRIEWRVGRIIATRGSTPLQ